MQAYIDPFLGGYGCISNSFLCFPKDKLFRFLFSVSEHKTFQYPQIVQAKCTCLSSVFIFIVVSWGLKFQFSMMMLWGPGSQQGFTPCFYPMRSWAHFFDLRPETWCLNWLARQENLSKKKLKTFLVLHPESLTTMQCHAAIAEELRKFWAEEADTAWFRDHPIFQAMGSDWICQGSPK